MSLSNNVEMKVTLILYFQRCEYPFENQLYISLHVLTFAFCSLTVKNSKDEEMGEFDDLGRFIGGMRYCRY